jgi:hypothetical protein
VTVTVTTTRKKTAMKRGSTMRKTGTHSVQGQPELSRAWRRELKKKEAAEKAANGEDSEDELLVNLDRVTKKLNISDLSAPREVTR